MRKEATISNCGTYRYRLLRRWDHSDVGQIYGFVGINPSTADAEAEDSTTRKWEGFVRRWGGEGYVAVNLFALRATDVRELRRAKDPFGPLNGLYLRQFFDEVDVIVPCWGRVSTKVHKEHHAYVRYTLAWLKACRAGKPIRHLGLTKDGDPRHPLMLSYDTPLEEFSR